MYCGMCAKTIVIFHIVNIIAQKLELYNILLLLSFTKSMTWNYSNLPMGVLTRGYELGVGVYLKAGNHDPLQQLLIGVAENP